MSSHIHTMLHQAIQAFQNGNLNSADTMLTRLLKVDPKNLPALHIIGLVKAAQGNYKESADYLRQAVRLNPNDPSIQYNLAKALADSGNDKDALSHHKKAVALDPNNPQAWLNFGQSLFNLSDYDEAIVHFKKALNLCPAYAEAALNIGVCFKEQKRYFEAITFADKALAINPSFAEAWSNKGTTLKELERYNDAIAHYDKAIQLKPDYAEAWLNKGNVLKILKEQKMALVNYDKAIQLKPDYAEAWAYKGALLHELKCYNDAVAHYDKAIQLKPDYAEAWFDKGNILNALKQQKEAIAHYDKALQFKPNYAEAWFNKGLFLYFIAQTGDSRACFEKSLECNTNFHKPRWSKVFTSIPAIFHGNENQLELREQFFNELEELEKYFIQKNINDIYEVIGCLQPFYLAYQEQNNRKLLSRYGALCCSLMSTWQEHHKLKKSTRKKYGKIKIGIVSEQIRNHSVWNAITKGILFNIDKTKFDIHLFHLGNIADKETNSAITMAASYTNDQSSLLGWVKAIIEKDVDVLLYPEIGMDPITLQLACLRLAPTQIASWGHPETTGLPTIDYFLSAEFFENDLSQDAYSENLLKLPNLGCNYSRLFVTSSEFNLEKIRINPKDLILVCPGTPFKYTPQNDQVLVEICKRLINCRLIFFSYENKFLSEFFKDRLEKSFNKAGLNINDYVVFLPWLKSEDFYGLMKCADVFLDTIGFSGFNTAMQAIDCALPIVAFEGQFMRGRFASGILKRMGLSELITRSHEDYINLAARLGKDALYRDQIKKKLVDQRNVLYGDMDPIIAFEKFIIEKSFLE
jgi:protein O-GlcNAc transferase